MCVVCIVYYASNSIIWRRYSRGIKVSYVTRISPACRPSLVHVRSKPRRIIARSRFVRRQTISVLLHQSGQPTHPRFCLPLLPSPQDGILKRNKFAFQPTSLVLERAAASVYLRKIAPRKAVEIASESPPKILWSKRYGETFWSMIGTIAIVSILKVCTWSWDQRSKIGLLLCRKNFFNPRKFKYLYAIYIYASNGESSSCVVYDLQFAKLVS